jgi:hypothetical protein
MATPADGIDWQAPNIVQTASGAKGVISSPTGVEEKPCFTCSHWIKNNRRVMQHFIAHGLEADENGHYQVPTRLYNRSSIKVDPKEWGWCPKLGMPTAMLATCEDWQPTTLAHELARKI